MKQFPGIEEIEALNILQLNDLVVKLGMDKYYYSASMRTLKYSEDVLKDIAEYCTIGRMIQILEYDCRNTTGIRQEYLSTKTILHEVAEVITKDIGLCDVLFSNVKMLLDN